MMWKDFFYFTKTERQGLLLLVVIIIGVFLAPTLLLLCQKPEEETSPAEKKRFEQEYEHFIASTREIKSRKVASRNHPSDYRKQKITLTTFDPNTADSLTFLSLGLPPWMAKNILNYRRKGGKFHNPESFQKIYGLTAEHYQQLRPYIQVSAVASQDTNRLITAHEVRHDARINYEPGTVVNLNKADTTELKKIPGIGSGIARMIVGYRQKLGGFYQIEQLQEIHLNVEKLRPWLAVDASLIRQIPINTASVERLMHHPYISYYQAKVIVEYRKKKGRISHLRQLSLYEEFTPKDMERIAPYVCCD